MLPATCSFDPKTTHGAIGMFHCPECGEMVLAGMSHPGIMEESDWDELDRLNREYAARDKDDDEDVF